MNPYIRPDMSSILGQNRPIVNQEPEHPPVVAEPPKTLWGKIKARAKSLWSAAGTLVEKIKDNIVPIVNSVAGIIAAMAALQGRRNCRNKQRRQMAWAA